MTSPIYPAPTLQNVDFTKTRYFFLWFLLYNIYVRVFAPSTPEGGVAMPSLSEGNLDLKRGYLDHGFSPKPEISGL